MVKADIAQCCHWAVNTLLLLQNKMCCKMCPTTFSLFHLLYGSTAVPCSLSAVTKMNFCPLWSALLTNQCIWLKHCRLLTNIRLWRTVASLLLISPLPFVLLLLIKEPKNPWKANAALNIHAQTNGEPSVHAHPFVYECKNECACWHRKPQIHKEKTSSWGPVVWQCLLSDMLNEGIDT